MKVKILLFLLLTSVSFIFAQSDYELVQEFKTGYENLRLDIIEATTIEKSNSIEEAILLLKDSYLEHKKLLDKSLYPETYDSSFRILEEELVLRRSEITLVSSLDEEVIQLKGEITELSSENAQLISEIQILNIGSEKDAATIRELRKLNSQLKNNIEKRDLLVRGMIDTLLTGFVRAPTTLNQAEKQTIIGEIENKSLFYNIERVISDNVDYLEVTEMTIEDFTRMRSQYDDFNKAWGQLGTMLADVYLTRKDGAKEVAYIDGLFDGWDRQINGKIWEKLHKLFQDRDINLLSFSNGDLFKESVIAFIESEISNCGLKKKKESEKVYDVFTDGVYYKHVMPNWLPFLINHQLINRAHKIDIEAKIAEWKEVLFPPPSLLWFYIIIVIMVAIQVTLYVMRRKKKLSSDELK